MRDILGNFDQPQQLSDPDPVRRAQIQMKAPVIKRFYKTVSVEPHAEGFAVHLDGKPVLTPLRTILVVPTRTAAELVAAEFEAQVETINPVTMPVLRLVNTAIDGVQADPQAVLEDILRFSSTDLLYYRAGEPARLVERQAAAWDPVLDWAREVIGARFILAEGVMHVQQPRESIRAVGDYLQKRGSAFELGCLHVITTLTGSALIALAVDAGEIDTDTAWTIAHVDEDWTNEHWGEDFEAAARRKSRRVEMDSAVRLLEAIRTSD